MPTKRKPIAHHKAAGTYRKDRHGGWSEPHDLETVPPAPPESLTPPARKEWERIVHVLGTSGRLTALDSVVLQQYCELAAEHAIDPRNFSAAKHTQLRMCASELGLTPTSRSKVPNLAPKKPKEASPWAAFQ